MKKISKILFVILCIVLEIIGIYIFFKQGNQTEVYAASGSSTSDLQLMARAINGEARGEPYEGQVAVGAVILNRVKSSKFPNTIAGVIYQSGAFTAVADGQINVPIAEGSTVLKAAQDAMNGWDPSGRSNLLLQPQHCHQQMDMVTPPNKNNRQAPFLQITPLGTFPFG